MNAPFEIHELQASAAVGISDLKRNPSAVVAEAEHREVAILNRNRPVAYLVSPAVWRYLNERHEELRDAELMQERLSDSNAEYEEVAIDDLV